LRPENFPVAALVDACLLRARPLADRKQIRFVVEPLPSELALTGYRELLEYAFYNLVTNAVKYSPQQTTVTVTCEVRQGRLRLAARGQGIGRGQKEEQSGEAGTGIGSIVAQIVSHHGGSIEVASAPGQGSCFTLVLPGGAAAVAEQS
jgi:signal transduction histidine kinase